MASVLRYSGVPLGVLVLVCATAQGEEGDASARRAPLQVEVTGAVHHDASLPLWLLPPAAPVRRPDHETKPLPRPNRVGPPLADPALQAAAAPALAPLPRLNVDGGGEGFSGPSGTIVVRSAPSYATPDMGPKHDSQTVNSD